VGSAASAFLFRYVTPITLAMIFVLVVLVFSYRQTIKAYPSAGGAHRDQGQLGAGPHRLPVSHY
jgi:hypothetical protein